MRVVGFIPARFDSSRFPGKPLADIHGHPMIAWVHGRAARADLDELYVATDDERIAHVCRERDIPVIMTSNRHPTGTDRVAEAATRVEADIYVNIQGDEPTLLPETVDLAVAPFRSGVDVAVTNLFTEIRNSTELLDSTVPKVVVNGENRALFLSRLPIPYPKEERHVRYLKQVCVYGFRREPLQRFLSLGRGPSERAEGIEILRFIEHGIPVQMVECEQDTVAVDTPSDLEAVRRLLESRVFPGLR